MATDMNRQAQQRRSTHFLAEKSETPNSNTTPIWNIRDVFTKKNADGSQTVHLPDYSIEEALLHKDSEREIEIGNNYGESTPA